MPYSTVFFLVRLGAIVHILLWQEVDELVSQIAERPGHGIPWFMSLLVNVYVIAGSEQKHWSCPLSFCFPQILPSSFLGW